MCENEKVELALLEEQFCRRVYRRVAHVQRRRFYVADCSSKVQQV